MLNYIGTLRFISLTGSVERPSEQIDRPIVRPGVDGVGLWKTGVRGRPFRLRSMVDQPNLASARFTFKAYRALIGGGLQDLIQQNYHFMGAEGFWVAVVDVRLLELKQIATAVGGINPPSGAKLVAEWDLIAVARP